MSSPGELVRAYATHYNARALEALERLIAPNFHIDAPTHELKGGDAYLETVKREWARYADAQVEIVDVIETGNRAAVELVWSFSAAVPAGDSTAAGDSGTASQQEASHQEVFLPCLGIWEADDDMLTSYRAYWDALGFLGQLGVQPSETVLRDRATRSRARIGG